MKIQKLIPLFIIFLVNASIQTYAQTDFRYVYSNGLITGSILQFIEDKVSKYICKNYYIFHELRNFTEKIVDNNDYSRTILKVSSSYESVISITLLITLLVFLIILFCIKILLTIANDE
jgi:hypothetical protein